MKMDIEMQERCKGYMGEHLLFLRKKLGMSQSHLADMIGISRQSYNGIENGKRAMRWETFLALELFFLRQPETGDWIYYNEVLSPEGLFQREECCEEEAAEQG